MTFVNPEPLAPFADVIAAGEGEVLSRRSSARSGEATRPRRPAAARWRRERGFYIPSFYEPRYGADGTIAGIRPLPGTDAPVPVRKAALQDHRRARPAGDQHLHARHRIRIALPRRSGARLREPVPLLLGRLQLPAGPRRFPTDRILQLAEEARPHTPARVGLVSIALCDHPDIERILARLLEMGYAISPASLRLDDLTEPIVRMLRAERRAHITIAPETGSDRLRRVINKTVTNDEILDRAELIFANGIENLKLYYMIGLPTETDDDLVAIRDLTLQLRERHAEVRAAARARSAASSAA